MRDARAQGREIRRARRDRFLARRRTVELALHAAPVIAAAVLLHALSFIVWDIGTRPPARLLADIRGSASSLRALARALWQFVLGLAILCAGAMLMLSVTVVDVRRDFAVLEGIGPGGTGDRNAPRPVSSPASRAEIATAPSARIRSKTMGRRRSRSNRREPLRDRE